MYIDVLYTFVRYPKGALEGDIPPHFHCTCPPVGDSQVCGPSLSPADIVQDESCAVAAGCSYRGAWGYYPVLADARPVSEVGILGLGKATQMYQRTQQVLKAARLLPAHRRLPHKAQSRKKASTGPHFTIMSDQRPHPSAAKSWSRCRSGVSQCSNVDCIPGKWGGVAMQHAVEKTFLVAQPVQPVALTSPVACYQSAINKWRP